MHRPVPVPAACRDIPFTALGRAAIAEMNRACTMVLGSVCISAASHNPRLCIHQNNAERFYCRRAERRVARVRWVDRGAELKTCWTKPSARVAAMGFQLGPHP